MKLEHEYKKTESLRFKSISFRVSLLGMNCGNYVECSGNHIHDLRVLVKSKHRLIDDVLRIDRNINGELK